MSDEAVQQRVIRKTLYIAASALGKVLKSSAEIVSYLFLDSSSYAAFIVLLNQAQIVQSWSLSGFGAAGYKIFGENPNVIMFARSLILITINSLVILIVIYTSSIAWSGVASYQAVLCGISLAMLASGGIYFRAKNKIITSLFSMEIIPYALLLFVVFLGPQFLSWDVGEAITFSMGMSVFALIIIVLLNSKSGGIPKNSSLKEIYIKCAPFFMVSVLNVFLSKADTTVLNYFAADDVVSSYAISSRFAAVIMTVSYIFQHLHLPIIIQSWEKRDRPKLRNSILNYAKDTFNYGGLVFIAMTFAYFMNVFDVLGFSIDLPVLLVSGGLYLLISPLTVFSYLLILSGRAKVVLLCSILGFSLAIVFIAFYGNRLDGLTVALVFLGSVLVVKLIESLIFLKIFRSPLFFSGVVSRLE